MAANPSQLPQGRHTVNEEYGKQRVTLQHGNTLWEGFVWGSDISILWVLVARQVWHRSEWRISGECHGTLIETHYMAIFFTDQSLPAVKGADQLMCTLWRDEASRYSEMFLSGALWQDNGHKLKHMQFHVNINSV